MSKDESLADSPDRLYSASELEKKTEAVAKADAASKAVGLVPMLGGMSLLGVLSFIAYRSCRRTNDPCGNFQRISQEDEGHNYSGHMNGYDPEAVSRIAYEGMPAE